MSWTATRTGDAAATPWEHELAGLRPALVRLARNILGSREEAEDVVHTAFLRALARPELLRPGTDLPAWLRTVVRNLAIDLRRRPPARTLADEVLAPPDRGEGDRERWHRFSLAQVREVLRDCPSIYRRTFEQFHFEGRTYAEIAAALGVASCTVGTRLLRARNWVKKRLLALPDPGPLLELPVPLPRSPPERPPASPAPDLSAPSDAPEPPASAHLLAF